MNPGGATVAQAALDGGEAVQALLSTIELTLADMRYRHRLPPDTTLDADVPWLFLGPLRAANRTTADVDARILAWFSALHAVPLIVCRPCGTAVALTPDVPDHCPQCGPAEDVSPTTGGPTDESDYPGCGVCYYRDDLDRGEVLTPPREGCRVHTPWAFPGYSLTDELVP